ncbi:hypothetical protein [Wolbachia endosymbiont of Pentidionis agamae]|uniref:hypothetical protein n=1 Tax=Wolbachia endosymbiont of Pentidionis agamae TaxID=3110435 RepID=UPI002FD36FD4
MLKITKQYKTEKNIKSSLQSNENYDVLKLQHKNAQEIANKGFFWKIARSCCDGYYFVKDKVTGKNNQAQYVEITPSNQNHDADDLLFDSLREDNLEPVSIDDERNCDNSQTSVKYILRSSRSEGINTLINDRDTSLTPTQNSENSGLWQRVKGFFINRNRYDITGKHAESTENNSEQKPVYNSHGGLLGYINNSSAASVKQQENLCQESQDKLNGTSTSNKSVGLRALNNVRNSLHRVSDNVGNFVHRASDNIGHFGDRVVDSAKSLACKASNNVENFLHSISIDPIINLSKRL